MPHIESTVVIRAPIPRVFDLIARTEEFASYSSHVAQVVPLGEKTHRWEVHLAGITLEWDSITTERRRPDYLAWRSIAGMKNSGSYALAKTRSGTLVTFAMEYHLPSRVLDEVAAPVLEPMIEAAVTEVLEGIRERLENDAEPDRPPTNDTGTVVT